MRMEKNTFSLTALGTAFMRGYHARFDHPLIFNDPLAYGLLTEKERFLIGQNLIERLKAAEAPQERSCLDETSALRRALQVYSGAATFFGRSPWLRSSRG
jgi:O-methyltransferase involved in polyketide biosynthesis